MIQFLNKALKVYRGHHRELHLCGDEAAWWQRVGIEPTAATRALWLTTHPLRAKYDANTNGTGNVDAIKVKSDHTKGDRPRGQPGGGYKTKPIGAVRPDDVL